MPSDDSPKPPFESRYPELKLPEYGFQSSIPSHLLDGCDDQTRWLMTEISKNTAATEFACRGVVDLSNHLRTLNGKTYRNEKAVGEAIQSIEDLQNQAKVMTPFLGPITMFAKLWDYTLFKWFFVGGIAFFLLVLYPYLLRLGLLDILDSYFKSH